MKIITWSLQAIFIILLPAVLAIGAGRLVMNTIFLNFEYTRAGFPEDEYGFTTDDRLAYGPLGIQYILNNEAMEFLGDLELEGAKCYPPNESSCPAFNPLELQHMQDVQAVAQGLFTFAFWASLAVLALAIILWRFISIAALRSAMMQASSLTIGLIIAIIILALFAWDNFFASFHSLFFAEGTWQFYYSDTLIRLYPQQFWFDAALLVGAITSIAAVLLLVISMRMPNK